MKRLLKIMVIFTLCLAGLAMAGMIWGVDLFFAPHPPGTGLAQDLTRRVSAESQSGVQYLEKSCAFQREGVWACYLEGGPETRGAAWGRFFPDATHATERFYRTVLQIDMPQPWLQWIAARVVTIRDSKLITYIPLWMQEEMAGFSQASENILPQWGSYFSRLVQMQRLYDVAHRLPPERGLMGLAFGVSAPSAEAGCFMGGQLDLSDAQTLDENKVVTLVKPDNSQAYCMVGWPGLFGAFAGMNHSGIGIIAVPAHAGHHELLGRPVTVLVRQVLAEAVSLEHAVEIIRSAEVMQSQSFLVGSGKENVFAVVEKSPDKTVVRNMRASYIAATDFFQASEWEGNTDNLAQKQSGPSFFRYSRLKELLRSQGSEMDAEKAVAILRDRRGEFGNPLGLGNMRAINSLNAVLTVCMDLRSGTLWVAAPPHQVGKFVAFELDRFLEGAEDRNVAQDPFFLYGKYNEYLVFQHGLKEAERFFAMGKYQESLAWLQEVRPLNPEDYRLYLNAGRALFALKRPDAAKYNYRQAEKLHPAYTREKTEIRERQQALEKMLGGGK